MPRRSAAKTVGRGRSSSAGYAQPLKDDTMDDGLRHFALLTNPPLGPLILLQILSISVYSASGYIGPSSLNQGQHRRVSIYQGVINLEELSRAEVVGGRSSATLEDEESGWDGKALVDQELVPPGQEVSVELDSGKSKAAKKARKVIVTGKTCSPPP